MGLAWHPVWAYLGIRVSCNGYNIVLREKCGCWVLESVFKECSTLQNLPTGIIKTTLWLKGITGNKRKGNVCLQDPSRSRLGLVYSYTQVYLLVWALKKKKIILNHLLFSFSSFPLWHKYFSNGPGQYLASIDRLLEWMGTRQQKLCKVGWDLSH